MKAAPAGVAAASRRTTVRANLALLAVSTALVLAVLEVIARILLPRPLPWLFPQTRYVADHDLGFALVPAQLAYSADKPIVINARGLRGSVVPYARTPGTPRLMFLGDSITFGYGVNDEEVVAERTAALLGANDRRVEVVNMAVPAYDTVQEVASLGRDGVRYDPDWVIVGVCWNDIGDTSRVRVDAAGDLTIDTSITPSFLDRIAASRLGYACRNALKRSRLLYGSIEGYRSLTAMLSEPDPQSRFREDVLAGRESRRATDGWPRFTAALRRLKRLSDEHGFRALIVTFPIPLALEQPFPASSYPAGVKAAAEAVGLPVLDLEPAFRAGFRDHESLFIAYDADHPNAGGHDVAAREIARYLVDHGFDRSDLAPGEHG